MLGRQFVERLSECNEARQVGDSLFLKCKGITGSVPALMMQGDDLDGFGRQADRPTDAGAYVRMMALAVGILHQQEVVLAADQIQIVGKRPQRKVLLFRQRELELVCDQRRVEAHAVSVIDEVAVLRFEQIGNELDQRRGGFPARDLEQAAFDLSRIPCHQCLPGFRTSRIRLP